MQNIVSRVFPEHIPKFLEVVNGSLKERPVVWWQKYTQILSL